MLEQLRPYIHQEVPFPFALTLQALNFVQAGTIDDRRREAANAIKPGAGDLLPWSALSLFIRAEIDDAEAQRIMVARRAYIERASRILPSVLRLIDVFDVSKMQSILIRLDDCCHDYPLIAASKSSKAKKREIFEIIEKIETLSSELIEYCDKVEYAHCYEQHVKVLNSRAENGGIYPNEIDQLAFCLRVLRFTGKVVVADDLFGYSDLSMGGNRSITHIVQCVYEITSMCGGVKFVTTPGSNFSFLCGLVLEMACGASDQGLAGAIGKFSRSSERRGIDQYVREIKYENSDQYIVDVESDNFDSVKSGIKELQAQRKKWERHFLEGKYDPFDLSQILIRIEGCDKKIEELNRRHGPNLVWASQMPRDHLDDFLDSQADMLDLDIKLGELRRLRRAVDLKSPETPKRGQLGGL